jgi:PAS domain-containing protein
MPEWTCTNETLALAFTLIGGLATFLSFIYVKIVKPGITLIQSHDNVVTTLTAIKKELTTNGGNSLKDAVICLGKTCDRIETRQKVMEQRTKASLHYHNVPLLETDHHGRLAWANNSFYEMVSQKIESIEGYDWLIFIHEDDREDFLEEFQSCLKMNRKLIKDCKDCEDKPIHLVGFPYKISEESQGGFLLSITHNKEI